MGAAPLIVAVHHNPRFSDGFVEWVGELTDSRSRPLTWDALAEATPGSVFAAPAVANEDGRLQPDLDALLYALAEGGLTMLVAVASGMDDPLVPGLRAVTEAGGAVVALDPRDCAQPALVEAAIGAGVVDATVRVEALAWVIGAAKPRPG